MKYLNTIIVHIQISVVIFIAHEIIAKVNSGSALIESNSGTNNPKP